MKPIINLTDDGFLEIEPPTLGPPSTRLSDDVAASATTSTVENNDDFVAADLVVFGKRGQEKTEIVTLTSTTGHTTLDHTTGPVFAHSARDPVAKILYNQAEIYTATSETGTYSLLTTVNLNLQKEVTIYDASGQTAGTWFKVRFKQSTSYSSYSDTVVLEGYEEDSLHHMTDEVLEEMGDPDAKETSRETVRNKLRAGVRELTREMIKNFPDYNHTGTTQDLTASTAEYDLPTRFLAFDEVWINFSGTTKSNAYKVEEFERELSGEPDTTYYESDPRVYFKDDQWGIKPTPDTTGSRAWMTYWYYPAVMSDEADEHGLPQGARDILVLYALWRLWRPKDREIADSYREDYRLAREDWIIFVAQMRQTKTKKRVKVTFGADLYDW